MSLRHVIAGAGVVVGAFHARLLAVQLLDGDLSDPGRVVRWLVAGGVAAMLVVLVRHGESLAGRKAVAAWAVAAMLHGPALTDAPAMGDVAAPPEAVITLLQVVIAGATLGLILLGAAARGAGRRSPVLARASRRRRPHVASFGSARPFAPRPPPRPAERGKTTLP